MQYRRFGRTDLRMPVLTCGGMRYQQAWNDLAKGQKVDPKGQANTEATIQRAFELGINHFETARGYGTSEYQLGLVLPSFPREEIIVQTKVGPKDSEDEFLEAFETSLKNLQLDYVDLLGIHGINTHEILDKVLRGGTLSACRKLQDRGLVRHVGFSTHGPTDAVLAAVQTDEFSYVNLHWYYFDQINWPAVLSASERDMGVFIISPSEKGGKLFDPPEKLVRLCSPLTPMGFNDLFCLGHAEVHTLSIGAARPTDFDAHLEILPLIKDAMVGLGQVMRRLEYAAVEALGADWAATWQQGLPTIVNAPKEVPLYHILRMYTMAKAFDMVEYGKMRYNLLGSGGHWFPGGKVLDVDWDMLKRELRHYHFVDRLPAILREAHAMFNAEDKKRLSEGG
ncbi:MAG: aldo/keto reductase [Kiritimatiellae bacterium]|nr:aldo/keto reductase [Kiritimatiellia bacterium]